MTTQTEDAKAAVAELQGKAPRPRKAKAPDPIASARASEKEREGQVLNGVRTDAPVKPRGRKPVTTRKPAVTAVNRKVPRPGTKAAKAEAEAEAVRVTKGRKPPTATATKVEANGGKSLKDYKKEIKRQVIVVAGEIIKQSGIPKEFLADVKEHLSKELFHFARPEDGWPKGFLTKPDRSPWR